MSWDVFLVEDLSDDSVLGRQEEVRTRLKSSAPGLVFDNSGLGKLNGDDYWIDFVLSMEDELVEGVMLHVRGSENAIPAIEAICQKTGWSALDSVTGRLIDFQNDPGRSLRELGEMKERLFENLGGHGHEIDSFQTSGGTTVIIPHKEK